MIYGAAIKLSLFPRAALGLAAIASWLSPIDVFAQSASPPAVAAKAPPRFEVASIKPAPPLTSDVRRSSPLGLRMDQAQASFGGMSLSALISYAYGVKLSQISGPDWLATERFDIVGKLPAGMSTEQVPEMLKALLSDRFGLKLHRETKEFSVYALAAAKTGAKVTPKPDDFDPRAHKDQIAIPILSLTLMLEPIVDLPVVDETGLKGQFLFSSESIRQAMIAGAKSKVERSASVSGRVPEASEPASSDIAALLLPVGMKLEKKKAKLPLLVVESMRQTPTEN